MLLSPSAHPASLAPRIGDDVLPTPTEEWAEKTATSIKLSADFNAFVSPLSRASTPQVPGAYPFEGEADYSRGIAFHQGYIRTQKNVVDAVMGAGASAKRYLPGTLASYLPSSTIKPRDVSQTQDERVQDADAVHKHPSIAENLSSSNHNEVLPDRPSDEVLASSVPSLHNNNEIDTSCLASHTNPDGEYKPSLMSDASIKTINGSMLSSPSRYSSQLSLTTPKNRLLHSSSETADTTHHGSEPGEVKHDHEAVLSHDEDNDRGTIEHASSQGGEAACQSSSKGDTIAQHGVGSDTPIGTPYPAFLGSIDSENRPVKRASGSNGVSIGSSPLSKSEETRNVSDTEGTVEATQPIVSTKARTHPLAGPDAKWHRIPLEEQYQKALDENSDRQLNLGSGNNPISITKPPSEEGKTRQIKHDLQGLKKHIDGTSNNGTATPRLRTTSVVFEKPTQNHQKSQRPASEEYTSGGASGGTLTKSTSSRTNASIKPSRASFMNKLKGEMMVITGKLSHDGAKVEEGRRLMGKIA
ncbi:Protein dml-1 [Termitomyces sp. T112]|nr:Protein dml-1 [Termitomyces sp. T112]